MHKNSAVIAFKDTKQLSYTNSLHFRIFVRLKYKALNIKMKLFISLSTHSFLLLSHGSLFMAGKNGLQANRKWPGAPNTYGSLIQFYKPIR